MSFGNKSTGPLPRKEDGDLLFLQYLLIAAASRSFKQLRCKIIQKKGPGGNFSPTIAQFEKYTVQVAILTDEKRNCSSGFWIFVLAESMMYSGNLALKQGLEPKIEKLSILFFLPFNE